jgi:regulator of cell morphogenesis and NO signaling
MQLAERRIGEIVTEDFRSAHLFSKYGIDFCCGGKKTLKEACEIAHSDFRMIESELKTLSVNGKADSHAKELNLLELIEYIVSKHHTYTRETSTIISNYLNKIVQVHGDKHPEVIQISQVMHELIAELLPHLQKEEAVLFPAMISIYKNEDARISLEQIHHPIQAMESEHEKAGLLIKELVTLTDHFAIPAHACTTWRVCYQTMSEFIQDLHTHIHLENNILFPKLS